MPQEKNRRLIQNGDIIYPFTRQENVIGLQKTITDKLPIVSSTEPSNYVEKQVWIDISDPELVEQSQALQSPQPQTNLLNSAIEIVENNNELTEHNEQQEEIVENNCSFDPVENNIQDANQTEIVEDNLESPSQQEEIVENNIEI